MPPLKKFQLLVFAICIGVGLLGLLILYPQGKLAWLDSFASPQQNTSIKIGAHIEDRITGSTRDRLKREIVPPSHAALDCLVCKIDDDPEQINAFGIYHPADLAITLNNLKKQNVEKLFISTHLRWPELDSAERNTLSSAMELFFSVVIATPLRRDIADQPVPEEWMRSSIPINSVAGNAELIPAINAQSLPPNIRVPENTHIGFSQLETVKQSESIPLIARWDDRVVFSATLLALTQHCDTVPEAISVNMGSYIRIGNTGNIIPIDEFGRYQPDNSLEIAPAPRSITSALSGQSSIIGATQTSAILTATGIQSSEYEALANPYTQLSLLEKTPRVSKPKTLRRLPIWLECSILAIIALTSALLLKFSNLTRLIAFVVSIFVLWLVITIVYHSLFYWSPISIYLITLFAGWTLTLILAKPARLKYSE